MHPRCLQTVYGKKYCSTHVVRAKNDTLIREYVKSMWADVGFQGDIGESGVINSTVGPLTLQIEPTYDRDSSNLTEVVLQIQGLADKTRKIRANLHDHITAVKSLKGAVVRSLRSKKSALTVQRKGIEERMAGLDGTINAVMISLGGELPPAEEDGE